MASEIDGRRGGNPTRPSQLRRAREGFPSEVTEGWQTQRALDLLSRLAADEAAEEGLPAPAATPAAAESSSARSRSRRPKSPSTPPRRPKSPAPARRIVTAETRTIPVSSRANAEEEPLPPPPPGASEGSWEVSLAYVWVPKAAAVVSSETGESSAYVAVEPAVPETTEASTASREPPARVVRKRSRSPKPFSVPKAAPPRRSSASAREQAEPVPGESPAEKVQKGVNRYTLPWRTASPAKGVLKTSPKAAESRAKSLPPLRRKPSADLEEEGPERKEIVLKTREEVTPTVKGVPPSAKLLSKASEKSLPKKKAPSGKTTPPTTPKGSLQTVPKGKLQATPKGSVGTVQNIAKLSAAPPLKLAPPERKSKAAPKKPAVEVEEEETEEPGCSRILSRRYWDRPLLAIDWRRTVSFDPLGVSPRTLSILRALQEAGFALPLVGNRKFWPVQEIFHRSSESHSLRSSSLVPSISVTASLRRA